MEGGHAPGNEPTSGDPRALRVTFRYTGEEIELVEARPVIQWVPPSVDLGERRERSGLWLELRDGAGAPVFRQDLQPNLGEGHEVFPADAAGEIVRSTAGAPAGVFSVVVPEMAQVAHLAVVASPLARERREEAASDRVILDFADLRRRAGGRW